MINKDKHSIIYSQIMDDYNTLVEDGREVVGVFLFGSQNYCCDTDESDIDTKAIVIPTVEDMILGTTKITTTYCRNSGELTVFDINSIHNNIKKQNINFVEILFTEYYYINPRYSDLWSTMRQERNRISRYSEYSTVQCINGIINNKIKKIFHTVESNKDRINKYGYDNKALADCIRLRMFLKKYIAGYSYEDCLIDKETVKEVLRIKKDGSILSAVQVQQYVNDIQVAVDKIYKEYLDNNDCDFNIATLSLINSVTLDCCKAYIKDILGVI